METNNSKVSNIAFQSAASTSGSVLKIAANKLAEAKTDASQIVSTARKKSAQQLIKARNAGKNWGLQKAEREVQKERLQLALERQELYQNTIQAATQDCLEMVLSIAGEVLQTEAITNNQSLINRIKGATQSLLEKNGLAVELHPESVDEIRDALFSEFQDYKLSVSENPEIPKGCAAIRTKSGTINLDWKEHFQSIKQTLVSKFQNR